MAWAEFEKTAEWARLSVRQKMFVQTYVSSGRDQVLATTCAYETSSKENTRIFSYELIKQPDIVQAMNRYYNLSPRDIFIQDIQRDIKASEPGSLARAKFQEI